MNSRDSVTRTRTAARLEATDFTSRRHASLNSNLGGPPAVQAPVADRTGNDRRRQAARARRRGLPPPPAPPAAGGPGATGRPLARAAPGTGWGRPARLNQRHLTGGTEEHDDHQCRSPWADGVKISGRGRPAAGAEGAGTVTVTAAVRAAESQTDPTLAGHHDSDATVSSTSEPLCRQ